MNQLCPSDEVSRPTDKCLFFNESTRGPPPPWVSDRSQRQMTGVPRPIRLLLAKERGETKFTHSDALTVPAPVEASAAEYRNSRAAPVVILHPL